MEDEQDTPPPRRPWWKQVLRWVGDFALYIVIAVVVVSLVRIFLIGSFFVPSTSMEQTLLKDDVLLTWKPGEPQRGSIIVFRDDLGWLADPGTDPTAWQRFLGWLRVIPPPTDQFLVKRLIGLPGDHITCCDTVGRIVINGEALDESAYLYFQHSQIAQMPFDVVVPQDRIMVMGDHRDYSADSRVHLCQGTTATPEIAFPPLESIQGPVFVITRPVSRMQTFKAPEVFSTIPDPPQSAPPISEVHWDCP